MKHRYPVLAISALCLAFVSCSDDEVPVYRVASDETTADPIVPEPQPAGERPLRWDAPKEWKEETPGQFQTALYDLGSGVTVSVSKFPGDGGGIPSNVNRWRKQIGLEPTAEPAGDVIALEAGDSRAMWFELGGASESILAAIVPAGGETWFFKLTAPNAGLEAGRPGFLALLKSIEVGEKTLHPESIERPGINLEVPEGWEKNPGNAMRAASFRIPSTDGIDGDVSVIPLPGDGGSDLENVNRWRAQLRLPPLESESDPALGTKEEGKSDTFLLTHMVSDEALFSDDRRGAVSTAILRKGGFTWFFKIAGEAEMVRNNREKFAAFVRSAIVP